jgi:hypothetical protein
MSKLRDWLVPWTAFGMAVVISVAAEGRLGIMPRFQAQGTSNCSATLQQYALAGAQWTMTISSIRTVTTADNAGNAAISGVLTYAARFDVIPAHGKPSTGVQESFDFTTDVVSNTTNAGTGVQTNYANIMVPAATLQNFAQTAAAKKYSKKNNPATIANFTFQPQWQTALSGFWSAPQCPITQLGPRNATVNMNANGTGNGLSN